MNRPARILAHVDLHRSGGVPCRVLQVRETPDGLRFDIELTATRGPWQRGERMNDRTARDVIPRGYLRPRRYSTTIRPYDWRAVLLQYGVTPTPRTLPRATVRALAMQSTRLES